MLKFFRLYQKQMLAVFVIVLMILFLIPQASQMFGPSAGRQVLGTAHGQKIRRAALEQSAAELDALARISPLLTLGHAQDATAWTLAVAEAEHLGISAGPAEVSQLLTALGIDEARLTQLANLYHADADFVRRALRHWIMVETYRSLALGEGHTGSFQRLAGTMQMAQTYGPQVFPAMADYLGQPRVSLPLFQRFVVDQRSLVVGRLLVIPADKAGLYLIEPTEERLTELFEQHKDQFPGETLGYRIQPRVKLDYLTIPFAEVLKTVAADEVDAIAYHEQHPDQFTDDAGKPLGYDAVRQKVLDTLRDERAQEKIDRMIRRARAVLLEAPAFRALTEADGYKVLPDGYTPMALSDVADVIEREFAVRPVVRLQRDQWVTLSELFELDEIGASSLADRGDVFFIDYVMSAKEMQPKADNPLLPLRLQVNVAGQPLRSVDGSRHLFRLIAAEPDHAPASLDEVRDKVLADARQLAAYEMLAGQAEQWKTNAAEQGLDNLAATLGLEVIKADAITRNGGNERSVFSLPGVGQSAELIRAIYQAADALNNAGEPIAQKPDAERLVSVPVEKRRVLALFEVDDYKPISQDDYRQLARAPQWRTELSLSLLEGRLPSPLDLPALSKRTGYRATDADEDQPQNDDNGDDDTAKP